MTGSGIKHPSLPNNGVNLTKHGVVQHASRASFIQSCFAGIIETAWASLGRVGGSSDWSSC
jgi:hypothetical protein